MFKPVFEKFKSNGESSVFKYKDYTFEIKPVTHLQAKFLNENYDYFYENVREFHKYIDFLLINKDEIKRFYDTPISSVSRSDKTKMLLNMICIETPGIRVHSFDYNFHGALKGVLKERTIINQFIEILISFGYKKLDIDGLSNFRIIKLGLEEMYYRDKGDFLHYVAVIFSRDNLKLTKNLKQDILDLLNELELEDLELHKAILNLVEGRDKPQPVKSKENVPYKLERATSSNKEKNSFSKIPE